MIDIKYTQNFYKNSKNLERIIKECNFNPKDIVIDIGSGNGNIINQLLKYCNAVVSYELDSELFNKLQKTYSDNPKVILKNYNFLKTSLPKKEFKVFANIPFSITSDIINKLTDINSNLTQAYIFVQKESAQRYMGIPLNTQISTILSYRYDISIIEEFNKEDFKPIPNVDIVLLKISKKKILEKEYILYMDFVTYIFNQRESNVFNTFKKIFTFKQLGHIKKYLDIHRYVKPSDIPSTYYLELFKYFKSNGYKYTNIVKGYHIKHNLQHSKREGVNRTRVKGITLN